MRGGIPQDRCGGVEHRGPWTTGKVELKSTSAYRARTDWYACGECAPVCAIRRSGPRDSGVRNKPGP